MITISNLHLGHVGFNCDFESQIEREREVLYLYILSVELVADKWNRSVDLCTKTQVFGEGGPIPVTLWPQQTPHGLAANFNCYHKGQVSFHNVAVMYTNRRSKTGWMCGFQARRQTREKRLLTSSCVSVCLSVLWHAATRLPLDRFLWNLVFEYYSEIYRKKFKFL
jgi:hypothetical protein